jgi:hypothetical protein
MTDETESTESASSAATETPARGSVSAPAATEAPSPTDGPFVPCVVCGKMVVVETGACAHCGMSLTPPRKTGEDYPE